MNYSQFTDTPEHAAIFGAIVGAVLAAALTGIFTFLVTMIIDYLRDSYGHKRANFLALIHFNRAYVEIANRLPFLKKHLKATITFMKSGSFCELLNDDIQIDTSKLDDMFDPELKNQLGEIAFKVRIVQANWSSLSSILAIASADFRSKIAPDGKVPLIAVKNYQKTIQGLIKQAETLDELITETQNLLEKGLAQIDAVSDRYRPWRMKSRRFFRKSWNWIFYRKWADGKPGNEKIYTTNLNRMRKARLENEKQTQGHKSVG